VLIVNGRDTATLEAQSGYRSLATARIGVIAKAVVTGGLLWLVGSRLWAANGMDGLKDVSPGWLLLGLAVLTLQGLISAKRWQWVIRALTAENLKPSRLFAWIGVATLMGQVLPGTAGGDIFRVGALARSVDVASAVRTVIADRAIGFSSLCLVAAISGALLAWWKAEVMFLLPFVIGTLGTIAIVGLVGLARARSRFPRILLPLHALSGDLYRVSHGSVRTRVLVASASIHLVSIPAILAIGMSFGMPIERAPGVALLAPCVLLVSAVPVSLGGWGVRESAMVVGFGILGDDVTNGLVVSIAFGIGQTLVGALGGLAWLTLRAKG
jgi:uncharacterized membrane protein YbhN (UPF0104 family)